MVFGNKPVGHKLARRVSTLCLLVSLASCSDLTADNIPPKPVELRPSATEETTQAAGAAIIFDTDYGFDVDDVGALAVLNALADNGETAVLAAITSVTDSHAAGAMDVVNSYYGRPDVPLGQNAYAPESYRWGKAYPYWRNPAPHFIADLEREYPHDTSADVPAATKRYRETLAAAPDGSVKIVAVGFMKNLADLMKSSADSYSDLSGEELISRKVAQLVVMGGGYPSNEGDFNLTSGPGRNASDAQLVIEAWPTEIVFTPGNVCGDILSGQTLTDPETNPVARAYELFFGQAGRGRASWDLCSVLYAVRGLSAPNGSPYFELATEKRLTLDDSGRNEWVAPGNSRHKRLLRVMPKVEMENVLNTLLTQPPR